MIHFLFALLLLTFPVSSSEDGIRFDRRELESKEDVTEQLANSLHDLSRGLLRGDTSSFAALLDREFKGEPLPEPSGATLSLHRHAWTTPAELPGASAKSAPFLESWRQFFAGLGQIEDIRFKVKEVSFNKNGGDAGRARIHFYVVARTSFSLPSGSADSSNSGRRIWVRGKASLAFQRKDGGELLFREFDLLEWDRQTAKSELFREVGQPAGVSEEFPAFGARGNDEFVSHGVAAADVNHDGLLDLFTTGVYSNRLYLNQGDGTFQDKAVEAWLDAATSATAPLFLDYDNDGDLDLFLARVGTQVLFQNRWVPDGELVFWDVSGETGVDRPAVGFSAVSSDLNADGYPDIYVTSYNRYGEIMPDSWSRANNGTPNLLFLSQGDGTYKEEASRWGVADTRWSYAATLADLDGDGKTDLYVANDFGENGLYLRRANGFEESASIHGLLDPGNGMGVSLADFDNDGLLDLHVTNMSSTAGKRILHLLFPDKAPREAEVLEKLASGNSLFRNHGNGRFRDVTESMGPFPSGWAFGGGFVDFDNDGWEDLHIPNGFVSGKDLKDT